MKILFVSSFMLLFLLGGFYLFCEDAIELSSKTSRSKTSRTKAKSQKSDAIIVLTGGSDRIKEGFRLLKNNNAPRILISGVHDEHSKRTLMKNKGFFNKSQKQRVSLDYEATTTIENAFYSWKWMQQRKVKKIHLVTSNYHMRRALLEFQSYLPREKMIIYAISPLRKNLKPWEQSKEMVVLYFLEYIKYLIVWIKNNILNLPLLFQKVPS